MRDPPSAPLPLGIDLSAAIAYLSLRHAWKQHGR